MSRFWPAVGVVLSSFLGACAPSDGPAAQKTAQPPPAKAVPAEGGPVIDHEVKTLEGEPKRLSDYRGKVLLIVNTASQCGYTPQFESLQRLYDQFQSRGLEVLAFPSNDFGGQEPKSAGELRSYLTETYAVSFPVFAKTAVKGAGKSPLYRTLTESVPSDLAGEVKWNFGKFLVDTSGRVVARFDSSIDPLSDDLLTVLKPLLPKS